MQSYAFFLKKSKSEKLICPTGSSERHIFAELLPIQPYFAAVVIPFNTYQRQYVILAGKSFDKQ